MSLREKCSFYSGSSGVEVECAQQVLGFEQWAWRPKYFSFLSLPHPWSLFLHPAMLLFGAPKSDLTCWLFFLPYFFFAVTILASSLVDFSTFISLFFFLSHSSFFACRQLLPSFYFLFFPAVLFFWADLFLSFFFFFASLSFETAWQRASGWEQGAARSGATIGRVRRAGPEFMGALGEKKNGAHDGWRRLHIFLFFLKLKII